MKNNKNSTVENPFFYEDVIQKNNEYKIIMSNKEKKKIKRATKELLDKNKNNILIISGRAGAGKRPVEKEISKNLPKKYESKEYIFGIDIINELRCVTTNKILKKNLIIFIDNLELSEAFEEEKLEKVIELILETSKSGVLYVLSCNPETLSRMYCISDELSKNSTVYNVPGLTYDIAKELVVSRLNRFRDKKSNSIKPFTESQLKNIWKTSKGNPRMILMLCGSLYNALKG